MEKVAVIGSGGAGKSTFCRTLAEVTGLTLVHLDSIFWRPGWDRLPPDEWKATHTAIISRNKWILDGNYGSTMEERIGAADTIIFLDMPRALCLWRVIKRRFQYGGVARPSLPPGCPDQVSFEFLQWVWKYPGTRSPRILVLLTRARDIGKRVVILRSPREVERFLLLEAE